MTVWGNAAKITLWEKYLNHMCICYQFQADWFQIPVWEFRIVLKPRTGFHAGAKFGPAIWATCGKCLEEKWKEAIDPKCYGMWSSTHYLYFENPYQRWQGRNTMELDNGEPPLLADRQNAGLHLPLDLSQVLCIERLIVFHLTTGKLHKHKPREQAIVLLWRNGKTERMVKN